MKFSGFGCFGTIRQWGLKRTLGHCLPSRKVSAKHYRTTRPAGVAIVTKGRTLEMNKLSFNMNYVQRVLYTTDVSHRRSSQARVSQHTDFL